MTTELEEQFFKVFGIEKKCVRGCGEYYFENGNIDAWSEYDCKNSDCSKCEHDKSIWEYPEITEGKFLQLLCIVIDEYNRDGRTFYLDSTNVEELKDDILDALMGCIDTSCDLFEIEVNQIQQLFKEEE